VKEDSKQTEMASSNTFILLILWMIIIMIGTSNTGKTYQVTAFLYLIFDMPAHRQQRFSIFEHFLSHQRIFLSAK
jgi:hypothetical protein